MSPSALNRRWYGRLWTVLLVIALATLAAGAAYVRSGETRLIGSAGESLTPSVVSFRRSSLDSQQGEILVGRTALSVKGPGGAGIATSLGAGAGGEVQLIA